jgi:hypothetical protein
VTAFSNYMVQHILYIKGVEKSIVQKVPFTHKQPTECAFGKMFYGTLKPQFERFDEAQQALLEQVEKTHIQFHESAQMIRVDNPESEQHQRDAWLYSARLINLLGQLEKLAQINPVLSGTMKKKE